MALKLMENTKTNTFRKYHEKVYNRNRNNYRIVQEDELTPEMYASAGYSVPKPAAPKPAAPKPAAPEKVKQAPLDPLPDAPQRPDTEGWTEEQLREFTQAKDIPTHPNAKSIGLTAAITRYFDDLETQALAGSGD